MKATQANEKKTQLNLQIDDAAHLHNRWTLNYGEIIAENLHLAWRIEYRLFL